MKAPSIIRSIFIENAALKGVAFVLTLALFIWVRDDREATVVATAPVRIIIPENMVMVSAPVDRVRLTVRGRWSDVSRFDPTELQAISLEATDEHDQTIAISEDTVILPGSLQVVTLQPEMIRIQLEPLKRKAVKIQPRVVGQPRDSYRIGAIEVSPPILEFSGPENVIEAMDGVWTEPIDVSDRTQTIERRVQLRPDSPLVRHDIGASITVRIPIETLEVTRTLQNVQIMAVNTTKDVVIKPDTLTATVRGPKTAVDAFQAEDLLATVDLAPEERRGTGTFEKQPQIKNLPPNLTLVDFHPKDVIVTLRKPESDPRDESP